MLSGGSLETQSIEMSSWERVTDEIQAQHYVSTKLLHVMLPHLSIYRSMPGPFRELWLELVSAGETIIDNAARDKDMRRQEFVQGIFAAKSLEIEMVINRYFLI